MITYAKDPECFQMLTDIGTNQQQWNNKTAQLLAPWVENLPVLS